MGIFDKWLKNRLDKMGYAKAEKKSAQIFTAEVPASGQSGVESDKLQDYKDFIEASQKLPWVDAGLRAIATAGLKPRLRVIKETKDGNEVRQDEISGEDINKIIDHPNNEYSGLYLRYQTISNLALVGNGFWHLVGANINTPISKDNPPIEIWWMKPNQVDIEEDKSGKGLIKKYIYKRADGNDKNLRPDQVIHFQIPNALSYFKGQSIMESIKNAAILEFHAITYNKKFMENDAVPGFVFTGPEINEEKGKSLIRAWEERHKGPKKTNRVDFLFGNIKPEFIQKTPQDIQYNELKKMNREEMLAVLGVPPSIVGLLEYANYSNMEVQQQKFWRDTVIPILNIFIDQLNLRLAPLFNEKYRFDFDYSNVQSLQEDEKLKAEVSGLLIEHGVKTPNQVRRELYKEEPYEGGNRYWMKFGLVEVGADSEGKKAKKALPPKKEENKAAGFWSSRKRILWDNFMKRVKIKEGPFADKVAEYLKAQAEKIKSILDGLSDEDIQGLKTIDLFDEEKEEKTYFDKFIQRYENTFVEAGEAGIAATKGILYDPDMKAIYKDGEWEHFIFTEELKAQVEKIVRGAAQVITKDTAKAILALIEKAKVENWTVEELTQEMVWKYPDMPNHLFSPARARTIATTEMTNTENFGQHEGYKQNPNIEKKGWLCSFVPKSRQAHKDADQRYSEEPIFLDEDFQVGQDYLSYPGDPRGSAENIINCYCTTFPVVPEA